MEEQNNTEPARVMDSITKLRAEDAGRVVIAGSHGGSYAAYCAARGRVRAVVLNDAGVGWQQAGIAGLDELQQWGVAAATADYRSCRIGDGADMARHGIISHVNGLAHALGCRPGMAVAQAARRLADADMAPTWPAPRHEARAVLATAADGTPRVIGADSVSLLEPADDGLIAVTASHGERLAGLATDGVRPPPLAGDLQRRRHRQGQRRHRPPAPAAAARHRGADRVGPQRPHRRRALLLRGRRGLVRQRPRPRTRLPHRRPPEILY
ncbi:hypothetical protein O9649_08920 [Achromobacter dolens]|uniref:hypothetical protein n=1 Tax=Achromobacter dolens TaxID=1287738 RepID=UPI0022B8C45B|nr:hypothetical protein [Achromobacter dolens]MCZ8407904.1 hypothetical protein [Achromobacter dolens]